MEARGINRKSALNFLDRDAKTKNKKAPAPAEDVTRLEMLGAVGMRIERNGMSSASRSKVLVSDRRYFFPALTVAHRAFCAMLIRLRAAADMVFLPPPLGLAGAAPLNSRLEL